MWVFGVVFSAGAGAGDNGSFTIGGTNSDELLTAAVFNFEVQNSYSIRVETTDSGGLTFEEVFTITVIDVNESPTLDPVDFEAPEKPHLRRVGSD